MIHIYNLYDDCSNHHLSPENDDVKKNGQLMIIQPKNNVILTFPLNLYLIQFSVPFSTYKAESIRRY